jgi:hypothetical protein
MSRSEYSENIFNLYNEGKISEETYDLAIMNIDEFTESEE